MKKYFYDDLSEIFIAWVIAAISISIIGVIMLAYVCTLWGVV